MELDSTASSTLRSRCFPFPVSLQGSFVLLHVQAATIGVCTRDVDTCVCKDGEIGGGGRQGCTSGKRETEREILELQRCLQMFPISVLQIKCNANQRNIFGLLGENQDSNP